MCAAKRATAVISPTAKLTTRNTVDDFTRVNAYV